MRDETALRPACDARPAPLVLASSSVYRRELLARLQLPFAWSAPDIDERALAGESADALVRRLAAAKAAAVARRFPAHLVIGSDQVAVIGDKILGKPGGPAQAIAQLQMCSGRLVQFLTAVCVLDSRLGRSATAVVPCDVEFRTLTAAQIAAYVATEKPYDCAGSFKAEKLGIALFERLVCDDPTALTGLPLIALVRLLAGQGFDVLTALPVQTTGDEIGQHAGT